VTVTWKSFTTSLYSLKIHEVSSSAWAVPLFPIKIVVPVGYALLVIVLLLKLAQGVAELASGSFGRDVEGDLTQSE